MINRLIFWSFILMWLTINSSCTSLKWGDFTAQKHTNLSPAKIKRNSQIVEEVDTKDVKQKVDNKDQIKVVSVEQEDLIESGFKQINSPEGNEFEVDFSNMKRQTEDYQNAGPNKEEKSYQRKALKTFIKQKEKTSGLGMYWLVYTLLILLASFVFIVGWYYLAFEGGFVFILMLILAILSMLGIMIHAWVKLIWSEGSEQRKRRALFLYVTGLSLVIITFLITFYFEA